MKNTDKTYGELILEAQKATGHQDVGETANAILEEKFAKIFCESIEGNKNITCDWYIWIIARNDAYADNATHLIPITRKTRPSPYQAVDHYLWKYEPKNSRLIFQWCIPRQETMIYVLKNPTKFDPNYVRMLLKYQKGELI